MLYAPAARRAGAFVDLLEALDPALLAGFFELAVVFGADFLAGVL